MDVPEKLELSRLAFDEHGLLSGFWIASRKPCGAHHTHRMATRPKVNADRVRDDIAGLMGAAIISAARTAGCSKAQLTVHEDNAGAIDLYERLGYRPVGGAALKQAASSLGYDIAIVENDVLALRPDYRLRFMSLAM